MPQHRVVAPFVISLLVAGCADTREEALCKKAVHFSSGWAVERCMRFLESGSPEAVITMKCIEASESRAAYQACQEKSTPKAPPPKLEWKRRSLGSEAELTIMNRKQIRGMISRDHRLRFKLAGSTLRIRARGLPKGARLIIAGEVLDVGRKGRRRAEQRREAQLDITKRLGHLSLELFDPRTPYKQKIDLSLPMTLELKRHASAATRLPPVELIYVRLALRGLLIKGKARFEAKADVAGAAVGVLVWRSPDGMEIFGGAGKKVRDLSWVGLTEGIKTGRSRLCRGLRRVRVHAHRTKLVLRRLPENEIVREKMFAPGRLVCPRTVVVRGGRALATSESTPRSVVRRAFKAMLRKAR